MKGQELINNIISDELPDLEQVRFKCVSQTEPQKHSMPRMLLRSMVVASAVAAVILAFHLFGNNNTPVANTFFISAHAFDVQENGSIALDQGMFIRGGAFGSSELIDGVEVRTLEGFFDMYNAISLHIVGENIKDVIFISEADGAFMIIQFLTENGEFVTTNEGTGLITLSERPLGNSFTLDDLDNLTDGYVLFAGKQGRVTEDIYITVRAVATFNDGTTQEEILEVHIPITEMKEAFNS